MEVNLEEAAVLLGIDLKRSIDRFAGSKMLYEKYLKKFLEDTSMAELEEAISSEDFVKIEKTAHTIKGVCANLGITLLADYCNNIVQCIRNNKGELLYRDESYFGNCRKEYDRVCRTLIQMK